MNSVLKHIARENFLKSGHLFFSERSQRLPWRVASPSRSPLELSKAIGNALRKRQGYLNENFFSQRLNKFSPRAEESHVTLN
ncbi:MAG: hypothetical protein CML12_04505 [Puniceicoccaceae bacterium]|nr:hypothetical protein [Puniceicoccaceae bacterium]